MLEEQHFALGTQQPPARVSQHRGWHIHRAIGDAGDREFCQGAWIANVALA